MRPQNLVDMCFYKNTEDTLHGCIYWSWFTLAHAQTYTPPLFGTTVQWIWAFQPCEPNTSQVPFVCDMLQLESGQQPLQIRWSCYSAKHGSPQNFFKICQPRPSIQHISIFLLMNRSFLSCIQGSACVCVASEKHPHMNLRAVGKWTSVWRWISEIFCEIRWNQVPRVGSLQHCYLLSQTEINENI